MGSPDIARARSRHATLCLVVDPCCGGPEAERLRLVRALCEELQRAVDDAYCREKLRTVTECAAELLSPRARSGGSGAEQSARRRLEAALALVQNRLAKLEQATLAA